MRTDAIKKLFIVAIISALLATTTGYDVTHGKVVVTDNKEKVTDFKSLGLHSQVNNVQSLGDSIFISDTFPINNSENISIDDDIIVYFDKEIRVGDTFYNISLESESGEYIKTYKYIEGNKVIIRPESNNYNFNSKYVVKIPVNAVTLVNNPAVILNQEYLFTYKTGLDYTSAINISDSSLEEIIRQSLQGYNGTITEGIMKRVRAIENLYPTNKEGISNLDGLQYASNLQIFSLVGQPRLSNITPISNLTRLRQVSLNSNSISDITPLGKLENLEELDMIRNKIENINPIANLKKLKKINMSNNFIVDISILRNLTELSYINFDYNYISDISGITGLTQLQVIEMRCNKIKDISAIGSMRTLYFLNLMNNSISDLYPLVQYKQYWGVGNRLVVYIAYNSIDLNNQDQLSHIEYLGKNNTSIFYTPQNLIENQAPSIKSVSPLNNSTILRAENLLNIKINFSEGIRLSKNSSEIVVKTDKGINVPYSLKIIYEDVLVIKPETINYNTNYTVSIPKGSVEDWQGLGNSEDIVLNYSTGIQPAKLNNIIFDGTEIPVPKSPINITAEATGGEEVLYKFIMEPGYKIIKDYSMDNVCQWTPEMGGEFKLVVFVKNINSKNQFDDKYEAIIDIFSLEHAKDFKYEKVIKK